VSDVYKLVGILKANGSVTASKVSGVQPAVIRRGVIC
jgi:hypothetical protein